MDLRIWDFWLLIYNFYGLEKHKSKIVNQKLL